MGLRDKINKSVLKRCFDNLIRTATVSGLDDLVIKLEVLREEYKC